MAFAGTIAHILSSGSNTDAASHTTASITLDPAESIVVAVTTSVTGTAALISSVTGTLGTQLTWTDMGNVQMITSLRGRTHLFYAKNTTGSAMSGTLTFNQSGTNSSCQWQTFRVTGAADSPLTGVNTTALTWGTSAANPSDTFPSTPGADNLIISAIHTNENTTATAGSGYTAIGTGFAATTPTVRATCEYDTSPVSTVAWTIAGVFNRGIIAVEIAAASSTTPVSTTRATTWDVLAQVSAAKVATWDTRAEVSAARTASFDVLASVSASRAASWDTLSGVTADRVASWDVRASVTATRDASWDVLASITVGRAASWDTLALVSAARAASWDTLAGVTATRETTWDVESSLASVSTTRATTWRVLAQVAGTREATWDTRVPVETSRATTWRVLAAITGTREALWRTLATATIARVATWRVLATVTASRSTTWDVSSDVVVVVTRHLVPAESFVTTVAADQYTYVVPAEPYVTTVPAESFVTEVQ